MYFFKADGVFSKTVTWILCFFNFSSGMVSIFLISRRMNPLHYRWSLDGNPKFLAVFRGFIRNKEACVQILHNRNLSPSPFIKNFNYWFYFVLRGTWDGGGSLVWEGGIEFWKYGFLALTQLPSVFKCCPQVTTMALSAWSFPSWKRPSPAWKPTRLLYTSVKNAARRIFLWGGWTPSDSLETKVHFFAPKCKIWQQKYWGLPKIWRGLRIFHWWKSVLFSILSPQVVHALRLRRFKVW